MGPTDTDTDMNDTDIQYWYWPNILDNLYIGPTLIGCSENCIHHERNYPVFKCGVIKKNPKNLLLLSSITEQLSRVRDKLLHDFCLYFNVP